MSDSLITIGRQQLNDVLTAVLINGNPFSTIPWEFSSGFKDINESNREDFCGEVFSRLKAISATGECDHCSKEERAVIDAAVRQREVYLKYGEAYHEYDADLRVAVDALLATRSKSEVRG